VRVLVVGGGIGGLAAGIGLRRVGIDVTVLEQARELEPIGAGIGLAANALHALDRLGVGDAIRARGEVARRLRALKPNGDVVVEIEGREMLGVHRADLQEVLARGAGDALRLGVACDGFRDANDRVVVTGADGAELEGTCSSARTGCARRRALGCSTTGFPATRATSGGARSRRWRTSRCAAG